MEINLDQDHNDPRSKYHSVIQDREKYQKKKIEELEEHIKDRARNVDR